MKQRKIEFEEVEISYARHVLGICGNDKWRRHIEADAVKIQYALLLNLFQRMRKSRQVIDSVDELKADIYDGLSGIAK